MCAHIQCIGYDSCKFAKPSLQMGPTPTIRQANPPGQAKRKGRESSDGGPGEWISAGKKPQRIVSTEKPTGNAAQSARADSDETFTAAEVRENTVSEGWETTISAAGETNSSQRTIIAGASSTRAAIPEHLRATREDAALFMGCLDGMWREVDGRQLRWVEDRGRPFGRLDED
jgi:hypothetical protein